VNEYGEVVELCWQENWITYR